ncbi:MAG: exodeoxyribonuclease VII large subunit [Solirubrobacteraceae bacterium]
MLDASIPVPQAAKSALPGPFPVGAYAAQLKRRLQQFAHIQLTGEIWGFRTSRVRVYFELRDARGALPCSMWRQDFDALGLGLVDGMQIVVGGGCDYYPGSSASSPSFSFAVQELHVAGEGDLLIALERLRRQLASEGLFEPQKQLPRAGLPRTIGVVTGERGKARDDVVAGLNRRGWGGRVIWAFAPVQDRHAAPRITAALRELAGMPEVDVVIVARGGGSLADLYAFCDESLCRTVALLRVPVISSVGHHTDRTLIDDVAAICCSTPTHAAEAAVPTDCNAARAALASSARRLSNHGHRAVLTRARALTALSRAPSQQVRRHRARLHQLVRELRASARRQTEQGRRQLGSELDALERTATRAAGSEHVKRGRELERLALALGAHDPERTMARGYALVQDREGEPLGSAEAARRANQIDLRFHDGLVGAEVTPEPAP